MESTSTPFVKLLGSAEMAEHQVKDFATTVISHYSTKIILDGSLLLLNQMTREILVHWMGLSPNDGTWKNLLYFPADYPNFRLEDKLFVQGVKRCGCTFSFYLTNSRVKVVSANKGSTSYLQDSGFLPFSLNFKFQ